ncbi:hypothetical protein ACO0K3_03005 [Undibacterium sp. Rencai35W]|uniref:hypothetical protein n=1 Tax=Undibacterium sp. Rencai35W TaxID=3413046 RepID=UPI003BEFE4CD
MVKKFVLMLIVAFTLQLSWTVASAYCMHETGKTSQHFGHHPHQHEASHNTDDQKNTDTKKVASHPDCASCTHSPLAAYTWQNELVNPLLVSHQHPSTTSELNTPYLGKPLRPKWMIAA